MPDIILAALLSLFDLRHFLFLGLGVLLGMVVGILPGLGGTAMLSLLLPFVFGKDPIPVLAMMAGLMAVNNTADTFPAVLMGIPGSSSSQATIIDGFPLAKRGEAARALGAAFSASMLGGLFGALVLTLAIHFARPIILGVGFGEQLMLIILALSMVGMLTGASALKGLATCGVGLLLGTIGAAPATGDDRLTFDTVNLSDGISVVIVGLAMFAIPEVVDILRKRVTISSTEKLGSGTLRGFAETLRHLWLVVRCSSIGTMLGALGVYMKRFGWSPPALLIGFVLSTRLDAAVYQSVQVYGMSFLERTGVQVMLALIVVSIILAVTFKRSRGPLTPDGPHAPVARTPQLIFLGLITACVVYAIYEMTHLTFLARVFPLSVALITLALLVAVFAWVLRNRPSYVLHDSEREWSADERPVHSVWHYQGWLLGLLGAAAVLGFVLGVFVYISVFLRVKARVAWPKAALAASGAVLALSLLSRVLVLDYPEGILQVLVDMPWPFN